MVSLKAAYIGNGLESFVEDGFNDGINVIYSTDNNRGKTILMQGIMYALGAIPTFPDGFSYREYIYIVDLIVDGRHISVLRSRNTFVVKTEDGIMTFDNAGDYARFWNERISPIPSIVKNGRQISAGLELYTQMFFIGQDNISSAKVNAGHFNKDDFKEMLYAIQGLDGRTLDTADEKALKLKREELKGRMRSLSKKTRALKERGTALPIISVTTDRRDTEELCKELDTVRAEVVELRKKRSKFMARKTKNQIVLSELRSLRREVKSGELKCLICGSKNIGYQMADSDVVFDVTSSDMRTQIINSIEDRIEEMGAGLQIVERNLRRAQDKMASLLQDNKDFTLSDVIACKDDYLAEHDLDNEMQQIQAELEDIHDKLEANKELTNELRKERKEFVENLLSKMNYAKTYVSGNASETPFDDLFTTNANVYSGSDGTIYFASREYAIATEVNHGMPILFDSFRADDLSTAREDRLLDLFGRLDNQAIFTTTIKKEEGPEKYEMDARVHSIDYSSHDVNRLLNAIYNDKFADKVSEFGVVITS